MEWDGIGWGDMLLTKGRDESIHVRSIFYFLPIPYYQISIHDSYPVP